MIILIIVLCIIILSLLGYIIYQRKQGQIYKEQMCDIHSLEKQLIILEQTQQHKLKEIEQLNNELTQTKSQIKASYDLVQEETIKNNALIKEIVNNRMQIADEQFEISIQQQGEKYQNAVQEYEKEYENVLQDTANSYSEKLERCINNINQYKNQLDNIKEETKKAKKTWDIIVQQLKNEKREKEQQDFFRLQISKEDLEEIEKLQTIIPYLRHKEALMKALWDMYYKKPFSDLINRLFNEKTICGIYKITNINDNMCYIGQSVNIKDRLRSHVRKGLGVDTPGRNKLYLAIQKEGIENFTFEILEECLRDELNEREKYWINFFKANEYGYNETKGNST